MKLALYSRFIGIVLLGCSLGSLAGVQEQDSGILHRASIGNKIYDIKEASFYTGRFMDLVREFQQSWRDNVTSLNEILQKTTPKSSRKKELVDALASYKQVVMGYLKRLTDFSTSMKLANNAIRHVLQSDSVSASVKKKLVEAHNGIAKIINFIKQKTLPAMRFINLESADIIQKANRQGMNLEDVKGRLNRLVNEPDMIGRLVKLRKQGEQDQPEVPQLAEVADEQLSDDDSDYDSSDDESGYDSSDDDREAPAARDLARGEQEDDSGVLYRASIGNRSYDIKEASFYTNRFMDLVREFQQSWRGHVVSLNEILQKTTPKSARKMELAGTLESYMKVAGDFLERFYELSTNMKQVNNAIQHVLQLNLVSEEAKEKLVEAQAVTARAMKYIEKGVLPAINSIITESHEVINDAKQGMRLDSIKPRLDRLVNSQENKVGWLARLGKEGEGDKPEAPQLAEIADEEFEDSSSDYDSSDDESDDE